MWTLDPHACKPLLIIQSQIQALMLKLPPLVTTFWNVAEKTGVPSVQQD